MYLLNMEVMTMKKKTAINIENEAIKRATEEIYQTMYRLAEKADSFGITQTQMIEIYREAYREQLKNKIVISDETEAEKAFRSKAEAFFNLRELIEVPEKLHTESSRHLTGYKLEYTNYHVEIICAAYKVFRSGMPVTVDAIYEEARYRMKVHEKYQSLPMKRVWPHLKAKRDFIVIMRYYYEYLFKVLLDTDDELKEKCDKFMRRFNLTKYETIMLKMIFLIENYGC